MASPTTVVTGIRANWGVSDCGNLMGQPTEAGLASIEPEGVYEHLAIGVLEEGYTLAYKIGSTDHVKYDVYESTNGIICVSNHICRNDKNEFVKITESKTDDNLLTIRQIFTISKNATRVIIRMEITNCHDRERKSVDMTDFLVKRYADIDVDTGGSAGWANFQAYWEKTRYSVFTYNLDSDAPEDKRAHVVNMVAMPSDLVLDEPFIGVLGSKQYAFRDNPDPAPSGRTDADGVLQWHANRLLAGETLRINMYYDAYRSFAK